MLSLLEITIPENNGRIRQWWHNVSEPSVQAYMRPVGGTHYMHINCEKRKERIDWKLIRSYSLDCSDRILLPKNIEPPEECGIKRFTPYEFRRRLLENTACDILVCSHKRPELRRVAIYGQESEVTAFLPRLTKLAGEIRVITRRAHAVLDTVEELRAKTGAAIGVGEQFDAVGFDMLIAPAGGAQVFNISDNAIVLSPDRPSRPVTLWINSAVPQLPQELEEIYREEFDLTEFVGGFYEAAELRRAGHMSVAAAVTESGLIMPDEAAEFIGH